MLVDDLLLHFLQDGGVRPVDTGRVIEPETHTAPPEPANRCGSACLRPDILPKHCSFRCTACRTCALTGRHGRATVVIDKEMRVWLGNEFADQMELKAGEIAGFNTGSFEFKISTGKVDSAGVPWRLVSDLDLVVVSDDFGGRSGGKKLLPLCQYLHKLATLQGLADVTLREHNLYPKMQAPSLMRVRFSRVCPDVVVLVFWEWPG